MKFIITILAVLFAIASVSAQPAKPPPIFTAESATTHDPDLDALLPSTIVTVIVDDSFIDAFSKRSASTPVKEIAHITGPDPAVIIKALTDKGVSGIIPDIRDHQGIIIIGGEIFRTGDEVCATEKNKHGDLMRTPIVKDCIIKVSSIGQTLVVFTVTQNTGPADSRTISAKVSELLR